MNAHTLKPGQIYHRRNEIHAIFKGQQYGGIATPAAAPFVFLFTGDAGEEFGYSDEFQPDGLYWYTGEGQVGDMQMVKGNAAIFNHKHNGKALLLFESSHPGHVRFVGEMAYVEHHKEERPDRLNNVRQAIVFHLELLPEQLSDLEPNQLVKEPSASYETKTSKLKNLKEKALQKTPNTASVAERIVNVRVRSTAIKAYALLRSGGMCEGCRKAAPFETKKGPFLEVHHVDRLADGGPDDPRRVIALCPNCHRQAHYAKNAQQFNDSLKARLREIETD